MLVLGGMELFRRRAPLGTPENPEIIEPGQRPRARAAVASRFAVIYQILRMMIAVSLPALALDWLCWWLFDVARSPDGALAWVPLFLIGGPAAMMTLVAVIANLFFSLILLLTLAGQRVQTRFIR